MKLHEAYNVAQAAKNKATHMVHCISENSKELKIPEAGLGLYIDLSDNES